MYSILQHSHSGLRYVSLLLLVLLVIQGVRGLASKKNYTSGDKRFVTITSISFHLQLLIGLGLYFMSSKVLFDAATMKSDLLRFFTLEHPLMMLISIVLVTVASAKAKRQNSAKSYKSLLVYGGLALIILIAGIPWPFREALGVGWF